MPTYQGKAGKDVVSDQEWDVVERRAPAVARVGDDGVVQDKQHGVDDEEKVWHAEV